VFVTATQEATELYLKTLEAQGKNPCTLYTYGQDCKQMIAFFGPDKKLGNLLPAHVARFYQSDALLKLPKTGKDRAPATVNKTKRVFRLMLTWTQQEGYLETLPLPKGTS
jgi:hypothetical protein